MSKVLLIGSGNRDKAKELRALLQDTQWEIKTLADFNSVPEPEETEDTFEGNAELKARYYAEQFGVACVADDSGIEVDALNGEPGVYSARYAGEDCTYDDNNQKLLGALSEVAESDRGARFVCCAAFVDGHGDAHIERGTVEGTLAHECRGPHGFGYDPLFVPEGQQSTFAEMDPATKSGISHRARAFKKMSDHLAGLD